LPVGEDVKVMVVRDGDDLQLTIAAAMLAPRLGDLAAYRSAVDALRAAALEVAGKHGYDRARVFVNAGDRLGRAPYLTLSGTSAECGDDGQVGRGNRLGGLITPMRPMTLEAYAGKNPATHVGKLLSLAAGRSAEACASLPGVRSAECVLVSRIGAPVSEPQVAGVRLDCDAETEALGEAVERIVAEHCAAIPELWKEIVGESPPAPA
jgi:S-adenosylmethionine synthetase